MKYLIFNSRPEEIPENIAKLASELHYQRTKSTAIDISLPFSIKQIDGFFCIEGRELIFTSIEARNHCTAINSLRKFEGSDLPLDAQKVFNEARELWTYEIGHSDFASGRFLGLLSEKLNILHAGIEIIASSDAREVFDILKHIGNSLPFLTTASIADIVDLAAAQHPKTSSDLAGGMFFNQVGNYLSAHPHLAKKLYTHVRENISAANTNLYGTALISLATNGQLHEATELALADTESACNELIAVALWTLGRLAGQWEQEPNLKDRVQVVLKAMGHHIDSSISIQAWRALENAAVSQPELVAELLLHAQSDNQAALQVLDHFLFMNFKIVKDNPKLPEILMALTDLEIGFTHDFDHSLSLLIEAGGYEQLAYDCLTTWILKHYRSNSSDEKLGTCFNQSIMALVNKLLLNELITRWLLDDELILGRAYSDLIGQLWVHGVKELIFAKTIIDSLNSDDFKYLARRLLGWTFHEEALISLTLSLLDTEDAQHRTFGWVRTLLVNDVGRNYPYATLQAIQEKLDDAPLEVANLLKTVQTELLAYREAINQLPVQHELYPPIPTRIRHAVAFNREKENREAMNKANENSIWQKICSTISIKAGTGSFSIYNGKTRPISRIASFSHFITLPAQYVIDPVNDEITKRGLRLAKRGDE